jgi:hypothetical protein
MPFGDNARHLVNPLHQNAAEEAVRAVEVIGAHNMYGFHSGRVYRFCLDIHTVFLSSVKSLRDGMLVPI